MTDVIEDAEHVLQRAIDLLDVFINRLLVRINSNIHRPLNRRTLLRWIAAFFPSPVNPRVRITKDLGSQSHMMSHWGSCGSLPYTGSMSSLHNLVEEDLGDNIVRYRMAGVAAEDEEVFEDTMHTFPTGRGGGVVDWDCITSTPNLMNASMASSDCRLDNNDETNKMVEMEEELANLRKQIAALVMTQEAHSTTSQSKTVIETSYHSMSQVAGLPLPISPFTSPSPNDSGCESNRPLSCCSDELGTDSAPFLLQAPPPPPPPPPPLFSSIPNTPLILKRPLPKLREKPLPVLNDVPTMSDVLKGLSSVKLKSIERSPGGTPFRLKPAQDPTDPAAIIANALRKKFALHRGFFTPDSDKENDSTFASPDPITPTNGRTTKRRLSLLPPDDPPHTWTPVSSQALQTLNV